MKKITIIRMIHETKQTIGFLTVKEANKILFYCFTLELPDKNNKPFVSCIPKGLYMVMNRYSKKHKNHLKILNVLDRTNILFHAGSFYTDIEGCILIGNGFADINKDGMIDLINSRITLKKLIKILNLENTFAMLKIVDLDFKKEVKK